MKVQRFVPLALVLCLGVSSACQLSLGKSGRLASQKSKTVNAEPSQTTAISRPSTDKGIEAWRLQVWQKLVNDDFEWIDREASKLRVTKERLPGGYWKLRALYELLEVPHTEADGNVDWEKRITNLQRWMKQYPRSITARVALAATWKNYAWQARGGDSANRVTDSGWALFEKRLANASQLLDDATSLDERCPHWFVVSLWLGVGERWDRVAFERMFEAAVKLEPTYYYLHLAKAAYLLPRWYGKEGEWERFAEQTALNVGGSEGSIIFFAIYSSMLSINDFTFMNERKQAWPRLLDGFRSIEKLYGESPARLNEACYFAMSSGDPRTAVELFNRIGDDFDQEVWKSKTNFELFRQGALMMDKAERDRQSPAK